MEEAFTDFDPQKIEEIIQRLRSVSNPTRVAILKLLIKHNALTVSEIMECLQMEQSYISQNLKVLKDAGMVFSIRKGRALKYTFVPENLKILEAGLKLWSRLS